MSDYSGTVQLGQSIYEKKWRENRIAFKPFCLGIPVDEFLGV